jgi:hypothetical protein
MASASIVAESGLNFLIALGGGIICARSFRIIFSDTSSRDRAESIS